MTADGIRNEWKENLNEVQILYLYWFDIVKEIWLRGITLMRKKMYARYTWIEVETQMLTENKGTAVQNHLHKDEGKSHFKGKKRKV